MEKVGEAEYTFRSQHVQRSGGVEERRSGGAEEQSGSQDTCAELRDSQLEVDHESGRHQRQDMKLEGSQDR